MAEHAAAVAGDALARRRRIPRARSSAPRASAARRASDRGSRAALGKRRRDRRAARPMRQAWQPARIGSRWRRSTGGCACCWCSARSTSICVFQVEALPRPGETVLCPGYDAGRRRQGRQPGGGRRQGRRRGAHGRPGRRRRLRPFLRRRWLAAGRRLRRHRRSRARPTGRRGDRGRPGGENQIIVASGANLATDADQVDDADAGAGRHRAVPERDPRPRRPSRCSRGPGARGARTILNLAPAAPVPAAVLDALDLLVVNEIEAAMAAGGARRSAPIWRATLAAATI